MSLTFRLSFLFNPSLFYFYSPFFSVHFFLYTFLLLTDYDKERTICMSWMHIPEPECVEQLLIKTFQRYFFRLTASTKSFGRNGTARLITAPMKQSFIRLFFFDSRSITRGVFAGNTSHILAYSLTFKYRFYLVDRPKILNLYSW